MGCGNFQIAILTVECEVKMILGLAFRNKDVPLRTRKAAAGLYVVENAYEGRYEYFESEDSQSVDTRSGSIQTDPTPEPLDPPSEKLTGQ